MKNVNIFKICFFFSISALVCCASTDMQKRAANALDIWGKLWKQMRLRISFISLGTLIDPPPSSKTVVGHADFTVFMTPIIAEKPVTELLNLLQSSSFEEADSMPDAYLYVGMEAPWDVTSFSVSFSNNRLFMEFDGKAYKTNRDVLRWLDRYVEPFTRISLDYPNDPK